MTNDDERRKRLLERLAKAGVSEEQLLRSQRSFQTDLSELDAPEAHRRLRAMEEIGAQETFAAVPRLKEMLADDAPVVGRGRRAAVFEVGMFALTVLQRLYRAARRPLDFGPVRVTKAERLAEVEGRAEQALGSLSPTERTEVVARAEQDLAERVRPTGDDRAAVLAYRILQLLGKVEYLTQHLDPVTLLTPLQEEIFASQVASERPRPCLRIGTSNPDRTLAWVVRDDTGEWLVDVSDHPLALDALADIQWLRERAPERLPPDDPSTYLRNLCEFLEPRFTVEVRL